MCASFHTAHVELLELMYPQCVIASPSLRHFLCAVPLAMAPFCVSPMLMRSTEFHRLSVLSHCGFLRLSEACPVRSRSSLLVDSACPLGRQFDRCQSRHPRRSSVQPLIKSTFAKTSWSALPSLSHKHSCRSVHHGGQFAGYYKLLWVPQ